MTTSPNDRYLVNGLRLAAKLITNEFLMLDAQDQQSFKADFTTIREAINAEIVKRGGTPYTDMEVSQ